MRNPKFSHAIEVVWDVPESLRALKKLAMNLRWSWHHETRDIFASIDPPRWSSEPHNPVALLQSASDESLERLSSDSNFLERLRACEESFDSYMSGTSWYSELADRPTDERFAYFCAEFGISEGLPIYSGGLGVLAGDHLKAASDLGLPLVGVGLLYSRGYFRQKLNPDGWQQEIYPQYDFYSMPLTLIKNEDNDPLRISVEFPDRVVTCQIWRAELGRVPLYLLDSNVLENEPDDQGITDTLYGGDEEMRIRQEMILGIGGMRLLRAVGINPTVCHMNEGHSAFLSLERIRLFMQDNGCDFRTARQAIVNGNVFTTHTPVPAGFDLFNQDLLQKFMGKSVAAAGIDFPEFLKLGKVDPENQGEAFNMAILAMGNSNRVNGVSKLHAKVTRGMFENRWPDYPAEEIPISSVTNGIHTATWISRDSAELYDRFLGNAWRSRISDPEVWSRVRDIPDADLWSTRNRQRDGLVRFVTGRLDEGAVRAEGVLDPEVLTIGFARRFATYKRATLMLADSERLLRILNDPHRPIQVVIAGKSHPRDDGGKGLIQDLVRFINGEAGQGRMVFVEDYDMKVARRLVQGVDLWLNNPRRPMEASGTSGMKVVPNGGLNCSILDGWWDEAYDPTLGFAIGNPSDVGEEGHLDWLDSVSLYSLLEQDIGPKFYNRSADGVPGEWIRMMKESIARLTPMFSTARMVQEYAEGYYIPASTDYIRMSGNGQSRATEALAWRSRVLAAWPQVAVLNSSDGSGRKVSSGTDFPIRAKVTLGDLSPADVVVQAIVGKLSPNRELAQYQTVDLHPVGEDGQAMYYEGQVRVSEPGHQGYTVRIVPNHPDVNVASELNLIRWQ
jgi:starch phosphorylase